MRISRRRSVFGKRLFIVLGLTYSLASSALGQGFVVNDTASCRQCRIVATKVVTLRLPNEGPKLVFPNHIVRGERGSYYVVDPRGARSIFIFNANGQLTATVPFSAPGAIRALAITPGDTLHVFARDESIFDREGKFLRTRELPAQSTVYGAIGLRDARLVLQASMAALDMRGQPYHVMSPDGNRQRSFGAEKNTGDATPFSLIRSIAPSGSSRFWSAPVNRYEVSLWSTDGELVRRIERRAAWFTPWTSWSSRFDVDRPPPRLLSMWQDDSGQLWTLTSVAARDWKPAGPSSGGEGHMVTADDFQRANETILEVINPASGALVVSQRFTQAFLTSVGDGLIGQLSTDRGAVVIDVWRVQVARIPGGI